MFNFKAIAVISLSTILIHNPVYSADLSDMNTQYLSNDSVSTPFVWAGVYGGIQGGYNWSILDIDPGLGNISVDVNGKTVGGFLGYNFQFNNNLVLGAEADINHTWNKTTLPPDARIDDGKFETSGSLRGKVGYAIDRLLVYGTAGIATAKGNYSIIGGADDEKRYHGWAAGVGIDLAVTENVFLHGQYLYSDYRQETELFDLLDITNLKQKTLQFGIGYKF